MITNQRLLDRARDHGWFAALTTAHEERGGGVLPLGPRGHAVVPRRVERSASRVRVAGTVFPRTSGTETVWDSRVPDLVFLRRDADPSGVPAGVEASVAPAGSDGHDWETALAFLRLGLSFRLLDRVLTHLGDRETGGAPLLHQQMIKGAIAEAVLDHLEIQASLDPPAASPGGASWAALAEVHRRITAVDRKLLLLFGASGFLDDGPGTTAYVSELLADAYVGPADWTEAA